MRKKFNMIKKIKWYNSRWFYLAVVVLLILSITFAATKTVAYFNYQEILKTEIDSLNNIIVSKDSLYQKLHKQKEKVRIIREKISTEEETQKIVYLEEELKKLRRSKTDTTITKDTPEELYKYFNK